MNTFSQRCAAHRALAAGALLAFFVVTGTPREVVAQAPTAGAPVGAEPGWYGYVPGQGWVSYVPPSAPAVAPAAPSARTAVPVAPGWAGYAPATGWAGYAPASSPYYPAPAVRAPRTLPADGSRRRAAHVAVNNIAPQLAYALPAYREYGSGRNVPLAKPWLPASP